MSHLLYTKQFFTTRFTSKEVNFAHLTFYVPTSVPGIIGDNGILLHTGGKGTKKILFG